MFKLYRLMCAKEFESVCDNFPFSWNKSCKWFTDDINFLHRVSDKHFNNSNFKPERYKHLVIYSIENIGSFERVSNHELMLRRKKEPSVKVVNITKVERFNFDLV